MNKTAFGLLLLIVPVGCFPWGNSVRPEHHGCAACSRIHAAGDCPLSYVPGPTVSPQEVTPENARSMAKALEEEMDRGPGDVPMPDVGPGRPRR
jgi:hypothetical protein